MAKDRQHGERATSWREDPAEDAPVSDAKLPKHHAAEAAHEGLDARLLGLRVDDDQDHKRQKPLAWEGCSLGVLAKACRLDT